MTRRPPLPAPRVGAAWAACTNRCSSNPIIKRASRSCRPGRPFASLPFYAIFFNDMTITHSQFATVEEAVEEIRQGRMIVLVDDEDRENEGDLTMAAEKITPDAINFMAKYGRGLICLTLTEQRCDDLHLPLMSPLNT